MDYTQIEVSDQDTIEDVAKRLASHAPASCVYHGVEILIDEGKSADDIVLEFRRHRRLIENRERIKDFAYSPVEVIGLVADGKPIDVRKLIRDPKPGQLYVVHDIREDFSIGSVGIAYQLPGPRRVSEPELGIVANEVTSALGSMILEARTRLAAAEMRIEAMELQLQLAKLGKSS
jgi:BMFP domain-containing protein YqiC